MEVGEKKVENPSKEDEDTRNTGDPGDKTHERIEPDLMKETNNDKVSFNEINR